MGYRGNEQLVPYMPHMSLVFVRGRSDRQAIWSSVNSKTGIVGNCRVEAEPEDKALDNNRTNEITDALAIVWLGSETGWMAGRLIYF